MEEIEAIQKNLSAVEDAAAHGSQAALHALRATFSLDEAAVQEVARRMGRDDLPQLKKDKVSVLDPEHVESFVTFMVVPEGQERGIRHRYNDFVLLRRQLKKRFPGFLIPELPPKKFFGRFEMGFIIDRMTRLERFLNRVLDHPLFSNTAVVEHFLKYNVHEFDVFRKEAHKHPAERIPIDSIASHYSPALTSFQKEYTLYDSSRLMQDLEQLRGFAKRNMTKFDNALFLSRSILDAIDIVETKLPKIAIVMDTVAAVEKQSSLPWKVKGPQRLDLAPSIQKWKENVEITAGQYNDYVRVSIQRQREDYNALVEAIDVLYQLAHENGKHMRGHPKPKEEEKEQDTSLPSSLKEQLHYVEHSAAVLLYDTFPSLYREHIQSYNRSLLGLSLSQVLTMQRLIVSWKQESDKAVKEL